MRREPNEKSMNGDKGLSGGKRVRKGNGRDTHGIRRFEKTSKKETQIN